MKVVDESQETIVRIRKLQQRDKNTTWRTDCYACEIEPNLVVFRCNLKTWGRIGAFYDHRMRHANALLEDLEEIILPTSDVRWLPIETLTVNQIKALDSACTISDQISNQINGQIRRQSWFDYACAEAAHMLRYQRDPSLNISSETAMLPLAQIGVK